jgi:hypothetical protein
MDHVRSEPAPAVVFLKTLAGEVQHSPASVLWKVMVKL